MLKNLTAKRLSIFAAFAVVLLALLSFLYYQNRTDNYLVILMFTPAISVVLARLITKEGTSELYLKPRIKGNVKWYLSAYLATPFVVCAGALLFFVLYPDLFDAINSPIATASGVTTPAGYYKLLATIIPVAILVNPIMALIQCFGEEFAWRGYVFPKLCKMVSVPKAALLTGVIWGVWHAPVVAMGVDYGTSNPALGVFAMIVLCVVGGVVEAFLFIKTKSVWAPTLFHAAINSTSSWSASALFMSKEANPFIGPDVMGIVGGIGLVIVAIFCFVGLCKSEKLNTLQLWLQPNTRLFL